GLGAYLGRQHTLEGEGLRSPKRPHVLGDPDDGRPGPAQAARLRGLFAFRTHGTLDEGARGRRHEARQREAWRRHQTRASPGPARKALKEYSIPTDLVGAPVPERVDPHFRRVKTAEFLAN